MCAPLEAILIQTPHSLSCLFGGLWQTLRLLKFFSELSYLSGTWHLCCFEWAKSLLGSHIWTLGFRFLALFEKAREPLGGRALLEEVPHWGQALRGHSLGLAQLLLCPLCSVFVTADVISRLPALAACSCLPHHNNSLLQPQAKINSASGHGVTHQQKRNKCPFSPVHFPLFKNLHIHSHLSISRCFCLYHFFLWVCKT